jgi:hypothetical protein
MAAAKNLFVRFGANFNDFFKGMNNAQRKMNKKAKDFNTVFTKRTDIPRVSENFRTIHQQNVQMGKVFNQNSVAAGHFTDSVHNVSNSLTGMAGVAAGATGAMGALAAAFSFGTDAVRYEALFANIEFRLGSVTKKFNDWVEAQSTGFGISRLEAATYGQAYLALTGTFSKTQEEQTEKAIKLLEQSAIIAQSGRTIFDVLERVRSGMLGNTEAIEDLGVSVSVAALEQTEAFKKYAQGAKNWDSITNESIKLQIRYYGILEQAAKGFGTELYDTTSVQLNIFIAQMKNASLAMQQAMLPALQVALPYLIKLANVLEYSARWLATFTKYFVANAKYLFSSSADKQAKRWGNYSSAIKDSTKKLEKQKNASDKMAKAVNGQTKAQNDYNKSLKKTLSFLLGIDEVNLLPKPEASASSAGDTKTGGGAYGGDVHMNELPPATGENGEPLFKVIESARLAAEKFASFVFGLDQKLQSFGLPEWLSRTVLALGAFVAAITTHMLLLSGIFTAFRLALAGLTAATDLLILPFKKLASFLLEKLPLLKTIINGISSAFNFLLAPLKKLLEFLGLKKKPLPNNGNGQQDVEMDWTDKHNAYLKSINDTLKSIKDCVCKCACGDDEAEKEPPTIYLPDGTKHKPKKTPDKTPPTVTPPTGKNPPSKTPTEKIPTTSEKFKEFFKKNATLDKFKEFFKKYGKSSLKNLGRLGLFGLMLNGNPILKPTLPAKDQEEESPGLSQEDIDKNQKYADLLLKAGIITQKEYEKIIKDSKEPITGAFSKISEGIQKENTDLSTNLKTDTTKTLEGINKSISDKATPIKESAKTAFAGISTENNAALYDTLNKQPGRWTGLLSYISNQGSTGVKENSKTAFANIDKENETAMNTVSNSKTQESRWKGYGSSISSPTIKTNLLNSAGVPYSVIDEANKTAMDGVSDSKTQEARWANYGSSISKDTIKTKLSTSASIPFGVLDTEHTKAWKTVIDSINKNVENYNKKLIEEKVEDKVKGFWGNIWDGVKTSFDTVWKKISDAVSVIAPWLSKLFGFEPPTPSTPPTPTTSKTPVTKMARGGIVDRPMTSQVGEAGAEMVVPLENTSFVRRIANAIGTAVGNSVGGQQSTGEISLNIDGIEFAKLINPHLAKDNQRVGQRLMTIR